MKKKRQNIHQTDPPGKKKTGLAAATLNPQLGEYWIGKKKVLTEQEYLAGIRQGDRTVLGRAITLVESTKAEHQQLARNLVEQCLPYSGSSVRIGITGAPGVGKSTFIESFGQYVTGLEYKPAVLAIDPSSRLSKGSILGDKTRMPQLASNDNAFIRPSPAGESLGGVARKTRETIVLCEAAGYNLIVVETVGVGQSETAVHSMVDFFLLLLLPGAGDELQGIKRGIVEMADLLAVNKTDGERLAQAKQAKREYGNALHLYPPKENHWAPKVVSCSALYGKGIENIWQLISEHRQFTTESGYFDQNRKEQARYWLFETIQAHLKKEFFSNPAVKAKLKATESAVLEGRISPFKAAEELMLLFGSSLKKVI